MGTRMSFDQSQHTLQVRITVRHDSPLFTSFTDPAASSRPLSATMPLVHTTATMEIMEAVEATALWSAVISRVVHYYKYILTTEARPPLVSCLVLSTPVSRPALCSLVSSSGFLRRSTGLFQVLSHAALSLLSKHRHHAHRNLDPWIVARAWSARGRVFHRFHAHASSFDPWRAEAANREHPGDYRLSSWPRSLGGSSLATSRAPPFVRGTGLQ